MPRVPSASAVGLSLTLVAAACAVAPPDAAAQATPQPAAETKNIKTMLACEDGKTVKALFINSAPNSVWLALSDGREFTLPQAKSASGARYANPDESVVFWNKGDTSFLEEGGKTTYRDCVTRKQSAPAKAKAK